MFPSLMINHDYDGRRDFSCRWFYTCVGKVEDVKKKDENQ